jgi:hypothetical protein
MVNRTGPFAELPSDLCMDNMRDLIRKSFAQRCAERCAIVIQIVGIFSLRSIANAGVHSHMNALRVYCPSCCVQHRTHPQMPSMACVSIHLGHSLFDVVSNLQRAMRPTDLFSNDVCHRRRHDPKVFTQSAMPSLKGRKFKQPCAGQIHTKRNSILFRLDVEGRYTFKHANA